MNHSTRSTGKAQSSALHSLRRGSLTTAMALGCVLLGKAGDGAAQGFERGKAVFANCAACHSLHPDEHLTGPSLYGIVGRKGGAALGYRYSNAVKHSGITWSVEALDKYLTDPQQYLPGNRMSFSGLTDGADRAALIRYLKSVADGQ